MANLLVDWLNGFELSSEVSDLGKDLRNGYLLAELFSSERAYESRTPFPLLEDLKDYNACTTLESSLKNFARLQDYLKHSCHLVLADDLVKDVMLQKRGAAAKLVFQVKCFLQPQLAKKTTKVEIEEVVETPRTLYSPRVPELSKDMQLAVQNKLNKLKLDAVLHLARFDKERVMNEAKCEAEERKEKKELLRLQKIRYQREREGRRRREELVQAKEREDIQAWRKNQVVKEEREKRELKFELTALLRKESKKRWMQKEHEIDEISGIETFSMNLKRLGIEEEDDTVEITDIGPLERLEAARKTDAQRVRAYLHEIKTKRVATIISEKEREQRRIKVKVDQAKSQKALNESKRRNALLKRIQAEAAKERGEAHLRRIRRQRKQEMQQVKAVAMNKSRAARSKAYLDKVNTDLVTKERERVERLLMKGEENPFALHNTVAQHAAESAAVCSWILQKLLDRCWEFADTKETESVLTRVTQEYFPRRGAWRFEREQKEAEHPEAHDHEVFKALQDLVTFSPDTHARNFGLRICVVGPQDGGKSSIATMIKHRFGARVISFSNLVTAVCGSIDENVKEIGDGCFEGVNEEVLHKVLNDLRDETKGDEDRVNHSVNVAKLVALVVAGAREGGSWVIEGFPNTLQQARMLDYTYTDASKAKCTPKEFSEYCKSKEADPVGTVVTGVVQCAFRSDTAEDLEHDAYSEWKQSVGGWLEEWSPWSVCVTARSAGSEETRERERRNLVDNAEIALIKGLKLNMRETEELRQRRPGAQMRCRHLEACDEHGTGERLDMPLAESILNSWLLQQQVYRARVRELFHRLYRLENDIALSLAEKKCEGTALAQEEKLPPRFESPSQQRQELIARYKAKKDMKLSARMRLESALWRTAFAYSEKLGKMFQNWEKEVLSDSSAANRLVQILKELAMREEENYSVVRALLQKLFGSFPQLLTKVQSVLLVKQESSARRIQKCPTDGCLGELVLDIKDKLRLHRWRDRTRGSLGREILANLSLQVEVRINTIADYLVRWKELHRRDINRVFSSLRTLNTSKLAQHDREISSALTMNTSCG